uniref:Uncharacterized protein n=1 Tax=Arundo donax TaxID=35708 RepID=A0A0A9CX62_ARUDO
MDEKLYFVFPNLCIHYSLITCCLLLLFPLTMICLFSKVTMRVSTNTTGFLVELKEVA